MVRGDWVLKTCRFSEFVQSEFCWNKALCNFNENEETENSQNDANFLLAWADHGMT